MSYFKGKCPHCGAYIYYTGKEETLKCNACLSLISVEQLNSYKENKDLASDFLTPEAGISYLEEYLEGDTLEYYFKSASLIPAEIDEIAKRNKIRNSNLERTYELEILAIIKPLEAKLAYLDKKSIEAVDGFDGRDNGKIRDYYNEYKLISDSIIENREALIKRLRKALESYKRLSDNEDLKLALAKMIDDMEIRLKTFNRINELKDIPEIIVAMEKYDNQLASEFEEDGVSIEKVYNESLELYNSGKYGEAAKHFEKLRGYKDSDKYLDLINEYYLYDDLLCVNGRKYVFRRDESNEGLDLKSAKKGNYVPYNIKTLSLYLIENGRKQATPLIKGIVSMISNYGDLLYYLKHDQAKNKDVITAYNFNTGAEDYLYEGEANSFVLDRGEYVVSPDNSRIYIKKSLSVIQTGCLKKKIDDTSIMNGNNFSLLELSFKKRAVKEIAKELVDINYAFGKMIFYSVSHRNLDGNSKQDFISYNMDTQELKSILDFESDIHNIVGNNIIYSKYSPSELNKNLYVYNVETNENTLIEDNIYEYNACIDGRIIYTIGNYEFASLYSNSVAGDDRFEIMQNVEEVILVSNGYLYIVRGISNDLNRVLMRISIKTSEVEYICTAFKSLVKMVNGYIYYISTLDELHMVRCDGANDRMLASSLDEDSVLIDNNCIYYLRNELVSTSKAIYNKNEPAVPLKPQSKKGCALFQRPSKSALKPTILEHDEKKREISSSIYRMDLMGHNIKKLAFDVSSMKNYNKKYIYFKTVNDIPYEVTYNPGTKEQRVSINTYTITRYMSLNKETNELERVLELGLPEEQNNIKRGCLSGKKDNKPNEKITYRELPRTSAFKNKRNNKVGQRGEALAEAEREANLQKQREKENKKSKPKPIEIASNNNKKEPLGSRPKVLGAVLLSLLAIGFISMLIINSMNGGVAQHPFDKEFNTVLIIFNIIILIIGVALGIFKARGISLSLMDKLDPVMKALVGILCVVIIELTGPKDAPYLYPILYLGISLFLAYGALSFYSRANVASSNNTGVKAKLLIDLLPVLYLLIFIAIGGFSLGVVFLNSVITSAACMVGVYLLLAIIVETIISIKNHKGASDLVRLIYVVMILVLIPLIIYLILG